MPFLRRRGNLASETDMRRHTLLNTSRASDNGDQQRLPAPASAHPLRAMEDAPSLPVQHATSTDPSEAVSTKATIGPEQERKARRFSLMRYRNASDPQLSLRAKQQAETIPPLPRPPTVVACAPTDELLAPRKAASRTNLAVKLRRSSDLPRDKAQDGRDQESLSQPDEAMSGHGDRMAMHRHPAEPRPSISVTADANGVARFSTHHQSDSSRSDASSSERVTHSSPTQKQPRRTTTFLKLRRNKKNPEPLFPLAHLPQRQRALNKNTSSVSLAASITRPASSRSVTTPTAANGGVGQNPRGPNAMATSSSVGGGALRSGQSSPTRANFLRGRSSTMSSMGRDSTDEHLLPPTARTSISTGRKSFGDLFGLGRIRQNSEITRQGSLTPVTPGSVGSKSNSLQLPRDSIVLPERHGDEESPAKYLARIEGTMSRGVIASALSKGNDPFSAAVLRSYMRTFSFFGDPMDMAIRKLLMEAELPKETQQIDRCLQAFANRYHECNPGIYSSPDQAYFIAFSLLILHTDVFNKNNKHKMQKNDYLKNTRGEGIFDDILECFYDNISYTPFIHVEDDLSSPNERTHTNKSRKRQLMPGIEANAARQTAKEPIDPYTLILDGNLDVLRPNLKEAMPLDDHYTYLGTSTSFNLKDLQNTFFKTGVLQIVSARSRPDAFMSERTVTNPDDAHPGIVDIKVTKVGLLWRKDAKKRKTRSPWQEWGAILTGAQLYFFRNTSWVKNLMHQLENHVKSGHDGIPVIFQPPLQEFKPDALMSTHAAVALVDTAYKKHKNAFLYVRQGGLDEVLLADSEEERDDWLAKLNYAAAFRTSGIRMRGVVGANYDGQGRRGIRRLDSPDVTQFVQTPTGLVSIARGHIDHKMAEDIQAARRHGMQQKIREANNKIDDSQKQLEEQMRNARHLQILAPIQPRTRDQLLLAAARLSAQLKWTRMDMWREKCHRDILIQDLGDDDAKPPLINPLSGSSNATIMARPFTSRLETGSKRISAADKSPNFSKDDAPFRTLRSSDLETGTKVLAEDNAEKILNQDAKSSHPPKSGGNGPRRESVSSGATSGTHQLPTPAPEDTSIGDAEIPPSTDIQGSTEDVDADERDFLKQAGLWEARSRRSSLDNIMNTASSDGTDVALASDRDRLERNKIRRSLQRTLRESAGHLSHHRSKRGRDAAPSFSPDDVTKETVLARGTGSFVVHGKKASVINLGTELQTLSQEEKILSRKQQHPLQDYQLPTSPPPLVNDEHEDDFRSALEATTDDIETGSRRGSAASASTATARSFRQLHRKYSSAQAARSASTARLTVHSDGESEAATSVSEGRRSFQLLTEKELDCSTGKLLPHVQDSPSSTQNTENTTQSEESHTSDGAGATTQRERDAPAGQTIAVS